MKDRSCCCPQLPISLPALTALLQFPSIMQLSRIANLRCEARECHWWNPLAGGLEVRRNKNWVSPTCISVYPSSSIVIQPPTYGAPLNLERTYHFFALPLPQLHISRLIVMTSLCRTHNLSSQDHPQSNILKPSLMWGAIIEKKGKKRKI